MSASHDTIAAIATPLGRGGIGVIRLSGSQSKTISHSLIQGTFPKPRVVAYRHFLDADGNTLDQGLIIYFPGPHSFTGEDVVEFQAHGSPAVLNALLKDILLKGARLAKPGEFSERAFLNQRLDLAQAEAIVDLIHAGSKEAAQAAMRSLKGAFSRKVQKITDHLIHLRAQIEAAIDFSEEGIALDNKQVEQSVKNLVKDLHTLQEETKQGQRLQEGFQLVIAGLPNAGKSSLLNALSHEETAIVSTIPGTTRDILTATIDIEGLPIHILDTAGLHMTDNIVEQEGIRRALEAINRADQILWVVDSTLPNQEIVPHQTLALFNTHTLMTPIVIIRNKADLSEEVIGLTRDSGYDVIRLSAVTKEGFSTLKNYLKEKAGYSNSSIGFSARARHTVALARAERSLQAGLVAWNNKAALEVLAVHLTEAHQALGEITGLFTTESLLGHIFSNFCIGK